MKKILFLFSLFLGACSSNAQTSDFLFKGIPIEGTVSEFSQKLQKQGFVQMSEYYGFNLEQIGFDRITLDMLSGMFMKHEVAVNVSGTEDTHEIQSIMVTFPASSDNGELYEKIKRLLADKYNDSEKWTIQDSKDVFGGSYKVFDAKIHHEPYISMTLNVGNLYIIYCNPTKFYDEGADL
jgi:lipoprotein